MPDYRLSARARRDLTEIWSYIAHDNIEAADRVFDGLLKACAELARSPRMGHPRPELTAEPVLFWPVGKYEIVYKTGSPIGVAAILHGSRDIKRILRKH
jgi:plasmid stabilization system protein ParE